ncbi:MAG: hypothetical protein Q8O74_00480 [bacterium]|nr:hypothetical protein [bacterium]
MKTSNKSSADLKNQPATKADLAKLETGLHKDMATKKDLKAVKDDVHVLKQDVSVLKTDMGSVKQSIAKLAIQTLKNTEMSGQMVTRDEYRVGQNKIMTALDKLLVMTGRNEQERVSMTEWVKRLDDQKADKTEVERLR